METIVSLPACLPLSRTLLAQRASRTFQSHPNTLQNSEIFTLTYGSIVRQLITDLEDIEEVNKQLDTM